MANLKISELNPLSVANSTDVLAIVNSSETKKITVADLLAAISAGNTPGGSTKSVQFNNSGAFGGTLDFVYDSATKRLGIGTFSPLNTLHVAGDARVTGILNIDGYSNVRTAMDQFGKVKTVNGNSPDVAGNVATALTNVDTGLSASRPTTADNGTVYVVSGETGALTGSNGDAYIYSVDEAQWFELAPADRAQNDARYVNVAGDTMGGDLLLNVDPTQNLQAVTKQYADQFVVSGSFNEDTSTLSLNSEDGSTVNIEIGSLGGKAEVSGVAPTDADTGSLWLDDTHTGEMFVYDGLQWVSVSGISGDDVTLNSNVFEGDQTITGSVNITQVMNLAPVVTLPAGKLGDLAVQGTTLFFFDGTSWSAIS